MAFTKQEITYFEVSGDQNTETTLRAVKEYREKTGLEHVVVASTTGKTGAMTSKLLKGLSVVVVTHHHGFSRPGLQELEEHNLQQILANGAKILTASHTLSGCERAIRKKFGTIGTLEIIANTLRLFGEGTKVCVEIVLMAADAGLIPVDNDVIAIAGSGRGADTALVIRPANSNRFFELEVKEIVAKPRNLH